MIRTDEDDEFDRIARENALREVYRLGQEIEESGQPYHWESDAIKAAVLIEREECAKLAEQRLNWGTAFAIRARSDISSKRVDTSGEHKHDN
jgi:hypothetical protein